VSAAKSRLLRSGQDAQRRLLIEAAGHLLEKEGPESLSLRRVTEAVDASTMVAYTLFGGKKGLAEALLDEALERLARLYDDVPANADPRLRLRALGLAYRAFALQNPAWFELIAGRALHPLLRGSGERARRSRAYGTFRDQVAACVAARLLPAGDPEEMADVLWATAHGAVSLELAGYFARGPAAERLFGRAIDAAAWGLAAGGPTGRRPAPRSGGRRG
jgi:AcrR family transcriptional regulator